MPETSDDYRNSTPTGAQGKLRHLAIPLGGFLVESFHLIALFVIGATTFWAAGHAFLVVVSKGPAISIEDLLLLFIYLEIGAMVGIYFNTNHMPVRFLIYIAITALTRHLVGYVNTGHKPDMELVIMSGSILILATAVLILRYASSRFPSAAGSDEGSASKGSQQP